MDGHAQPDSPRSADQTEGEIAVFGATGRVGAQVLARALAAGLRLTAVVRDPAKVSASDERLRIVTADALDPPAVHDALAGGPPVTAVIMAVGVDPLRASTVVTRSTAAVVAAAEKLGVPRYLAITGTAQMPATPLGKVTQFAVRRLVKAAQDHQGAFEIVTASSLDYVLAACPYIKAGAATGRYVCREGRFPGGFRTITPGDVADFLVTEALTPHYHRRTVGLWT